jgi:hypothetical protein
MTVRSLRLPGSKAPPGDIGIHAAGGEPVSVSRFHRTFSTVQRTVMPDAYVIRYPFSFPPLAFLPLVSPIDL